MGNVCCPPEDASKKDAPEPTIKGVKTAADEYKEEQAIKEAEARGEAPPVKKEPEPAASKITDLAIKDDSKADKFAKFEHSLPFCRIYLATFWEVLVDAKTECGNESFVTLESLQKRLDSPAWAPLKDSNSTLCKVILSGNFKDAESGQSEEQIDFNTLATFALLHC